MAIFIACIPEGKDTNIEIRKWFNKNWQIIFRPTNEKLAATLAAQALKAQKNKNIIFRYFQKPEIFNLLKENKWDFNKIKQTCTANNFSLISSCINAAGVFINQELTISNISKILLNTGRFNKLTNPIFTQKSDKLKIGDILVCDDDIAIVVSYKEIINNSKDIEGNTQYVGTGIGEAISINKKTEIRNGAGEQYKIIGIIKKDISVEVLGITQDYWYKIAWPQSTTGYAYTNSKFYNYKGNNPNPNIPKTVRYDIKVIIPILKIQQGTSINSPSVGILKKGTIQTIIKEHNNYGFLQSGKGWICLDGTEKIWH